MTSLMTSLALGKYHGLGNDFLVALDPAATPDGPLARRLCDRHRGIGADGLIVATTDPFTFRLFNADGSEAEMSGNGMRCLAHAALDAGLVAEGVPVTVATPAGPRCFVTVRRGPVSAWTDVEMGVAEVDGEAERCNVGHGELSVRVGNPHLVVAGPDPAGVDVAALGARLEASVPGGQNVEFVMLGPGPDELTMRVWERGVGETQACGTGSVAVAAAFHHWGRAGSAVTVHQPGGSVVVRLDPGGAAHLAGPSEQVAACTVPFP
ncbi:MAG: diaminopimelate epimerase [Acidimicrobiales bacterium]